MNRSGELLAGLGMTSLTSLTAESANRMGRRRRSRVAIDAREAFSPVHIGGPTFWIHVHGSDMAIAFRLLEGGVFMTGKALPVNTGLSMQRLNQ
jgi:hypothetical protein